MEQELNNLKKQFDTYINLIKNSKAYIDYFDAKNMLENSSEASKIINTIKDLQQAKNICKKNKQADLVIKIEKDLEKLNNQYDLLFEVVNFNIAYEKLVELVEEIKFNIEQSINEKH
ncbi:MAG: YlbF family regulator [Bacilli bacterium]